MNGFKVSDDHTLKVNILTDGPTISANYRDNQHISQTQDRSDLNDSYINSQTART